MRCVLHKSDQSDRHAVAPQGVSHLDMIEKHGLDKTSKTDSLGFMIRYLML